MVGPVIGVDPGLTGAIALVSTDKQLCCVADFPVRFYPISQKKYLDMQAFISFLNTNPWHSATHAAIERASSAPGQGVASAFTYGEVYGSLCTALYASGFHLEVVNAVSWKRRLKLPGRDKEAARLLALELFSYPDEFSRKKDHNRAEAALIALDYIQENLK